MTKRTHLDEEGRRFHDAINSAFDDFLLEKARNLDSVPQHLRVPLLQDWRMILEFGFCKGALYEMERCQEEDKPCTE
jgi:hypothetical protein